jgi:hypothetical protein
VQAFPRQPATLDGERVDVNADLWNVTIMRPTHFETYVWRKKHGKRRANRIIR